MEHLIPSQPQPLSLSGAGNADGALNRLIGQSVLVFTLLRPVGPIRTSIFHGSLRDIYPDAIVLEEGPGTHMVARSFLIYKQAIVAVEPAATPVSPDLPQPF